VHGQAGFEEAALADKEIRPLRMSDQVLCPARVAGVQDAVPAEANPETQRNLRLLVGHTKGLNSQAPHFLYLLRQQLRVFKSEGEGLGGQIAVHGRKELGHTILRAGRAADLQRAPARCLEQVLEKQKGKTGKVVSMQVAEENRLNRSAVDSLELQGRKGCRAAVQKENGFAGSYQVGGLLASASAKRIPRA
jgi:hypothetical protein